jgi:hypothetical protein
MGTPLSVIESHIEMARQSGFSIVDKISAEDRQIMICFDDGWKGLYDNKMFFVNLGVFPTVFIAVDLIGTDGYMSISQIKEMMDLGYHFESHAWSHTGLHLHTGKDLAHELSDSKEWLEKIFGKPFEAICFPQGNYTNEVIKESIKAGYKELYSSTNGAYNQLLKSDDLICRNLVQDVDKRQFKYIIMGDSPVVRNKRIKQHNFS